METIKVRSRYSKNIPYGKNYIIKDGKQYHAVKNIYNITFRETFKTLLEAGAYLSTNN